MNIKVVIVLLLAMQGCSSLNPLSLLTPKPSVEVNAQIAKNAEQEKSLLKLQQGGMKQTADTITNKTSTSSTADVINQISNQMEWWQYAMVIVLAGVALPSWKELYSGVKVVLLDTAGFFLLAPLKGIAGFVLKLLGRK